MKFETYISKKIKVKDSKIKPPIQTLNEIKKSIKKPYKLIIGIIFLIISLVFFIILMINFELLYYSKFSIKLIFLLIIGCSLGIGFILFVPVFLNFLTKRSEIKKDQEKFKKEDFDKIEQEIRILKEFVKYKGKKIKVRDGVLQLTNKKIKDIADIKGLELLTNLKGLILSHNQISEIKGLKNLENLKELDLSFNNIIEIKGLENLTNLENLSLSKNQISEIKGLGNLINLKKIFLWGNYISPQLLDKLGTAQKIVEYCRSDILEKEIPKIQYESITKPYTLIKEEEILNRSERIKTNADFPERWAMIYGKKPKERENFLFFKDIELNFSPKLFHPNYFHLKIVHFIEELGYRIEINKPPLSTGNHQDRNWTSALGSYDLNGTIKASIRTSIRKGTLILISLIVGIIFLVVSIVLIAILINDLLILKQMENIIRFSLFYVFLFLSAIAAILILLFLLNFKKTRGQTLNGYTNIYLIEQGVAYFGEKEIRDEVKKPIESIKMPLIAMDMKISIASAVKSMDLDKSRVDISKLWEKIEEYYNALI